MTLGVCPKFFTFSNPDCFHADFCLLSAFLKHAFREVTFGFCKGTVPGAPPLPSPGPPRMPKSNSKQRTWYHPRGTSRWRTCEVTLRSCAPPSQYTRPLECPKILLKKRTWYKARRHVCAKARLRNPDTGEITNWTLFKLFREPFCCQWYGICWVKLEHRWGKLLLGRRPCLHWSVGQERVPRSWPHGLGKWPGLCWAVCLWSQGWQHLCTNEPFPTNQLVRISSSLILGHFGSSRRANTPKSSLISEEKDLSSLISEVCLGCLLTN